MRCYIGDRWNAFGNAARSLPSGRPHTITRRRHTKHGGQICNAGGATVRNSARGGPMYLPNADHFRNSQFASTVAASAPTSCLSDRLHRRHIGARRALSRDGAGRAYPGLAVMPTPMPFSAKSLAQLALIPGPPPTIRATSCAKVWCSVFQIEPCSILACAWPERRAQRALQKLELFPETGFC